MIDIEVPAFSGSSITPMDAGVRPGYVVSVATIGEHDQLAYQGKEKPPAKELFFGFEIVGETFENDDGDSLPRVLSSRVKLIGGDNAKLTKYMKALDPTGEKTQGWKRPAELIGELCQVEVTKKEKKSSPGTYTNYIGSLAGAPSIPNWEPPARVSETILFDFYNPEYEDFLKLPRWVQNVCKEANDFPGSALQDLIAQHETTGAQDEGQVAHRV